MTTAGPVRVAANGRDNNFTVLRWVAAFAVLVSHAFPLAPRHKGHDLLDVLTGHELGWYAVDAFFVASGFLVTKSLWRRKSVADFLRARAFRIFPGLVAMLLVVVTVLGLTSSAYPVGAFWRHGETWRFLAGNATLLGADHETLPGVFGGRAVNGSLWTLPSEAFCYLLLAVTGLAGAASSRRRLWACLGLAFGGYLAIVLIPESRRFYPAVFPSGEVDVFPRLGFCFLLGVLYFLLRDRLPLCLSGVLLIWGLVPFSTGTPMLTAAVCTALGYTVFWFAYLDRPWLARLRRIPDYSYGIYIYAFPTQRYVYQFWPRMTPWTNILVAGAATLVLASLSWHFVEEPALRQVRKTRSTLAQAR